MDSVATKRFDFILATDVDEESAWMTPQPCLDYFRQPLKELGLPSLDNPVEPQQLGPAVLATYLRSKGYSVRVFDNVIRNAAVQKAFFDALDQAPPVVGISTMYFVRDSSVRLLAGWIRQRSPSSLIVLGGASAARQVEMRACADVTVLGRGERTMELLLMALNAGEPLKRVPNLICRSWGFEFRTPVAKDIPIEEMPVTDWGLLEARPSLCYGIEASTGCRYVCAFCSYPDLGNQRMKPIPHVVEELRRAHQRYDARLFRFVDSNLTSWPEQTEAMCRAISDADLPIQWGCFARADNFARHPSLAESMRRAGCVYVFMGIESGSDRVLRRMNKGCTVQDVRRGVESARQAGLRVHGNFIVGFPGETEETVGETLGLIESLSLDAVFLRILGVYDGTGADISVSKERYGLSGQGDDWSHPSMDSRGALKLTEHCYDSLIRGASEILVGQETFVIYDLMGNGLSLDESTDYLRALRAHHRGEALSDRRLVEDAGRRLKGYRLRINRRR